MLWWFGCSNLSVSIHWSLFCIILFIINTEAHSSVKLRKLIVGDVPFSVDSTSNVGGTTIKRLSVGDAARGDQRETGSHVGASGVDSR